MGNIAQFNFDVRLQLNLAFIHEMRQSHVFALMPAFDIVLSTIVSSPPFS